MHLHELGYWLALNRAPGIGAVRFMRLYEHFGSIKRVFSSTKEELLRVKDFYPKVIDKFLEIRPKLDPEYELRRVDELGLEVVTLISPDYPKRLTSIYDPPPVLYLKGNCCLLDKFTIAVVGSRRCTSNGRLMASSLARALSESSITVVSGLARGIDTAAHMGALAAQGRTIAVLGCGLDVVYPKENVELFNRIGNEGLLITEFAPGTSPLSGNFPSRNRIISGISEGVVLVEAGVKSGALITADFALEQGREVMAVPGNPLNAMSIAPNRLIKEGAALVTDLQDILSCFDDSLPGEIRKSLKQKNDMTSEELRILKCLTHEPIGAEDIVDSIGLPVSVVLSSLAIMSDAGLVVDMGNGEYSLPEVSK